MSVEKNLSHTRWNYKYHISYTHRSTVVRFYEEKQRAIGEIVHQLCEKEGVNIIEAEVCTDLIHNTAGDTAKAERFKLCGISEEKKQLDDIRSLQI